MTNREIVTDVVNKLTKDKSIDEISERLAFIAGVNEALAEADRGEGIPLEQVKPYLKIWNSKSS